jgi:chitinase
MFGPQQSGSSALRPFGSAAVDGFDFDFEATVNNAAPFANQLRTLMDAQSTKRYLTAAPQCPYPDAADNSMLNGAVSFDAIFVQFYNNYCGLTSFSSASSPGNFNFNTWDNWAKTVSKNKNVKVYIGAPASASAAGSGYVSSATLANIINYSKQYSSFGGVMFWDASQLWANSGYLGATYSALGASSSRMMKRFKGYWGEE